MLPVLILFTKAPVPGQVLQQLQPELTPLQASELHQAIVADFIERFTGHFEIELHLDENARAWTNYEVKRRIQKGETQGLRICQSLDWVLSEGKEKAILINTDCPTLPVAHLGAMVGTRTDVALGPTESGGFYGIAARRTHPDMLKQVVWSTAHTFVHAKAACARAGMSASVGPLWWSLDSPAQLRRLIKSPGGSSYAWRYLFFSGVAAEL